MPKLGINFCIIKIYHLLNGTDLLYLHNDLLNPGLPLTKYKITIHQIVWVEYVKYITNTLVQGSIWINDRINIRWYKLYLSHRTLHERPVMDLRNMDTTAVANIVSGVINAAAIPVASIDTRDNSCACVQNQ